MDKSFFIGKWVGDEMVLSGSDTNGYYTDANGEFTEDTLGMIKSCFVDVREDGRYDMSFAGMNKSGTWMEVSGGIGLVHDGVEEEIKGSGLTLEQVAVKYMADGDRLFFDMEDAKIYHKK